MGHVVGTGLPSTEYSFTLNRLDDALSMVTQMARIEQAWLLKISKTSHFLYQELNGLIES
jgi:hypothetical protein